jgi:hypothetical protein
MSTDVAIGIIVIILLFPPAWLIVIVILYPLTIIGFQGHHQNWDYSFTDKFAFASLLLLCIGTIVWAGIWIICSEVPFSKKSKWISLIVWVVIVLSCGAM